MIKLPQHAKDINGINSHLNPTTEFKTNENSQNPTKIEYHNIYISLQNNTNCSPKVNYLALKRKNRTKTENQQRINPKKKKKKTHLRVRSIKAA